jgi:hypothetical protein
MTHFSIGMRGLYVRLGGEVPSRDGCVGPFRTSQGGSEDVGIVTDPFVRLL